MSVIVIQERRGHQLVWHSGLWEEKYFSLYLKIPDRHLTMILLAAAACAAGLPLYTRNPDDFRSLGNLVEAVAV